MAKKMKRKREPKKRTKKHTRIKGKEKKKETLVKKTSSKNTETKNKKDYSKEQIKVKNTDAQKTGDLKKGESPKKGGISLKNTSTQKPSDLKKGESPKKSGMAFIVLFLFFTIIFGFGLFNQYYMPVVEFGIYINGIPLNIVIIAASLFLMIFCLLVYSRMRRSKVKAGQKREKRLISDLSKIPRVEIMQNETDFDALYKIVQERERIKLGALARYFKISKKQVEEWATILKEHELIDIDYPAFGEPRIIKVQEKR